MNFNQQLQVLSKTNCKIGKWMIHGSQIRRRVIFEVLWFFKIIMQNQVLYVKYFIFAFSLFLYNQQITIFRRCSVVRKLSGYSVFTSDILCEHLALETITKFLQIYITSFIRRLCFA
jgi:hypothetical protein